MSARTALRKGTDAAEAVALRRRRPHGARGGAGPAYGIGIGWVIADLDSRESGHQEGLGQDLLCEAPRIRGITRMPL